MLDLSLEDCSIALRLGEMAARNSSMSPKLRERTSDENKEHIAALPPTLNHRALSPQELLDTSRATSGE